MYTNIISPLLPTLILFIGICTNVVAQPELLLFRQNQIITRFREGESIRYRRRDQDHFDAGIITGMYSNYLNVNNDSVNIYQIQQIDLKHKINQWTGLKIFGFGMIVAGAGYLLLNHINNQSNSGLKNNNSSIPYILIAGGITIELFTLKSHYYKINRRQKLSIIQY